MSQGFVYYVSLTGVTGSHLAARTSSIRDAVAKIKAVTDKPVAVGFGISTPDQAAQVASWGADGVIVGSALVKVIEAQLGSPDLVKKAAEFAGSLKQGVLLESR
jgi:tryptophan synthase alpha chain